MVRKLAVVGDEANHPLSIVEAAAMRSVLAEKQQAEANFAAVLREILEARGLDPSAHYRIEGNVIVPVKVDQ